MNRQEIQDKAVSFIQSYPNLVLQWATGVGKSKATIEILRSINKQNVLLVVAETPHKNNWMEEFNKWNYMPFNLTIECYASLKNYIHTKWDIIIFDEAHHLNTDIKFSILKDISSAFRVFLSATMPKELIDYLNLQYSVKVFTVSLLEAIKYKMIPAPKIVLLPLSLDINNKNKTIIEEWGLKKKRIIINCLYKDRLKYFNRRLYPNLQLNIKCSAFEKHEYLTNKVEYLKKQFFTTQNEFDKIRWLKAANDVKKFLGENKTNSLKALVTLLDQRRFICFCNSIEQSELINFENSINSKKKNSLEIIEKFNNGDINNLFAVGMLQEGQNLHNIEIGIITQLDNTNRLTIQKLGRVLRADNPIQFILYYKNTVDEKYLQKALLNVDSTSLLQVQSKEEIIEFLNEYK